MPHPTNPRFVAYCRAQGRSVQGQVAHDRLTYPGGCMCGFLVWMNQQKRAFIKMHPECVMGSDTIMNQDAWTGFLLRGE